MKPGAGKVLWIGGEGGGGEGGAGPGGGGGDFMVSLPLTHIPCPLLDPTLRMPRVLKIAPETHEPRNPKAQILLPFLILAL